MVKKETVIVTELVGVIAIIALSRRAVAAEELLPDDVYLSDLIISPATVEPYEMVAVSAKITNISDKTGSYKLTLEGDFVAEKTVALSPGESKTVTFEMAGETPGRYNVQVD